MTISSSSYVGLMSHTSNISKSLITQNDSNNDSSLSIEELGIDEEQFSALDGNGDGLVTQNEIARAIDNKLASFNVEIPSKEEFAGLLSDLGLEMPKPPESKENSISSDDFSSLIMSKFDSDGDSLLSSNEVSLLSDKEFSALDTNRDGSISVDELSNAYEQVVSASEATQSAPPSGGSRATFSSEEEYDELDTNKDGVVSIEERNAALGISINSEISSTTIESNNEIKNTLKLLLDTIKLNSQNNSEELNLSNFQNIMKMMNIQSNNNELNTYVSNLSISSSSKFTYA